MPVDPVNKHGISIYYTTTKGIEVNKLETDHQTSFEHLAINLHYEEEDRPMLCVYRPQEAHKQECVDQLNKMLKTNNFQSKYNIILRDFNINLDDHPENEIIKMLTKDMTQLINDHTYVIKTIIDHIYVTNTDNIIESGVFDSESDHRGIYVVI